MISNIVLLYLVISFIFFWIYFSGVKTPSKNNYTYKNLYYDKSTVLVPLKSSLYGRNPTLDLSNVEPDSNNERRIALAF